MKEFNAHNSTLVLDQIFNESPSFMALLLGPDYIFKIVNQSYLDFTGKDSAIIGQTIQKIHPEIQSQGFIDLLDAVFKSGEKYSGFEKPLRLRYADGEELLAYIDFIFQPLKDDEDDVYAIFVQGFDVTEKTIHRKIRDVSKYSIENERENFRNLFKQTPEMVCILSGEEHVFEYVNESHIRMLGFNATGKTVREAQPESLEVHTVLDDVFTSGVTAELYEMPVTIGGRIRYFDLTYAARRDDFRKVNGVMILGAEVTEQVLSRRALQESQTRFRNLAEAIPAIVWTATADGNVTYYNRRWCELTGLTQENATNWGWQPAIHPEDLDRMIDIWSKCIKYAEPLEAELRILRASDKTYRWHLVRAVPIAGIDKKITEWFGTVIDIHEQMVAQHEIEDMLENVKNVEDSVRRTQERLALATESTGIGVWEINPITLKSWRSPTHDRAYGFEGYSAERETLYFIELILEEDRERVREQFNKFVSEGRTFASEYRVKWPNGSIHWMRTNGNAITDDAGRILRLVGTNYDITEQMDAKSELERAKNEAIRANELKSAFLANMSHEIRTPLGAMIGFADLLRDPSLSIEHRSAYLDVLARNGEQLGFIINDILDLSKVEAGHLTLELLPMGPRHIAEDVISLHQVKAQEKGLMLKYIFDESTPNEVISDPIRVRQILLNLIHNAIKFTLSGSVILRSYGLLGEDRQMHAAFEVTDTGIGIPDGQKDRIFEMFVQGDGSVTRKFGGTGLGLALSRKLARALLGDVTVHTTILEKGTTFLFTFKDQIDKRPSAYTAIVHKTSETHLHLVGEKPIENIRVLVVDDSTDNQQLIAEFLCRAGAKVESAENGLEGFKAALVGNHDVIIMDLQMPIMDGYTATQRLREHGYTRPIIALTAHAMNEVRKKCLNVGCTDHLAKPINPTELISKVARYAGSKTL